MIGRIELRLLDDPPTRILTQGKLNDAISTI